jgi:hypothetical protein
MILRTAMLGRARTESRLGLRIECRMTQDSGYGLSTHAVQPYGKVISHNAPQSPQADISSRPAGDLQLRGYEKWLENLEKVGADFANSV